MNNKAFSALLCAIASSIADAQRRLEEEQVRNFIYYFKKKEGIKGLCPRTLKMALPTLRSEGQEGERDLYKIPLFSILPHNGLKIEKTDVDFSVTLSGLDESTAQVNANDASESVDNAEVILDELDMPYNYQHIDNSPELKIDLNGNWGKQKGLTAQIKLTVSSVDLPEGTMRMIDEVSKTGQGYTTQKTTL